MRVGVVPITDPSSGGVYQYSLAFLEALAAGSRDDDVVIFSWQKTVPGSMALLSGGARIQHLETRGWRPLAMGAASRVVGRARAAKLRQRVRRDGRAADGYFGPGQSVIRAVQSARLDVIIELGYTGYGLASGVPFVLPIHDIQHRLQPEFPEVGTPEEWAAREAFISRAVEKAAMVLVDSEVGREDLLREYAGQVDDERVRVLPFVPAPYLQLPSDGNVVALRSRLDLPAEYLLFPAQFWPHKNHLRLTRAVAQTPEDICVVMTGGGGEPHRDRVLADLRRLIADEHLGERVRLVGHVPDRDMGALYSASRGVVLPTFFGPTNIPVVEAWALGIPVLTSDIPGIREQAGDAAVLVDPRSVESIADGLCRLWSNREERLRLVEAGRRRLLAWTATDYARAISGLLDELQEQLT